MGVVANFPVALASGLGLNAVMAYTLILGLGFSWQQAIGRRGRGGSSRHRPRPHEPVRGGLQRRPAVGQVRDRSRHRAVYSVHRPEERRHRGRGPSSHVPEARRLYTGTRIARSFWARRDARARRSSSTGGILAGIMITAVAGMIFGVVPLPSGVVDFGFDTSTIGGGVLAIPEVLQLSLVPVIFALFTTDFFDTIGPIIAARQEAKLLDEEAGRRTPR